MMKTTAVIPALNEEKAIGSVVKGLEKLVDEIIVVDDGSQDNTGREAEKAGATVVSHEKNCGVGGALKTGIRKAIELKADVILVTAGDGQLDARYANSLIKPVKEGEYDFVIASRFKGDVKSMPLARYIGNRIFTAFVKIAAGKSVSDASCGYRAFTPKLFDKLELGKYSDDYRMEVEFLLDVLSEKSFKVKEIPIHAIYGGENDSKMRIWKDWPLMSWPVIKKIFS